MLVIDDKPSTFQKNYGNGIRVSPFFGNPKDEELLHLLAYLERIGDTPNVRVLDKRAWRHLYSKTTPKFAEEAQEWRKANADIPQDFQVKSSFREMLQPRK